MSGDPHGDAVQPRPRQVADPGLERRDDGQRARPEAAAERQGALVEIGDRLGRFQVGDVGDQRVEARPALGGENPRHGLTVGGVGGEPVDRLGRQDDQGALAERRGSLGGAGHLSGDRR